MAVPSWSTGTLSPASYTSVSPASATQTLPEECFRGYFKGKFVPSLPGGKLVSDQNMGTGWPLRHTLPKFWGLSFSLKPSLEMNPRELNLSQRGTRGKP